MNQLSIIIARRAYSLGGRQGMGINKPNVSNFPLGQEDKEPWTNEMMTSAPKWNEKLATESEASVKADQEPVKDVEELKKKTTSWFKEHEAKNGSFWDNH